MCEEETFFCSVFCTRRRRQAPNVWWWLTTYSMSLKKYIRICDSNLNNFKFLFQTAKIIFVSTSHFISPSYNKPWAITFRERLNIIFLILRVVSRGGQQESGFRKQFQKMEKWNKCLLEFMNYAKMFFREPKKREIIFNSIQGQRENSFFFFFDDTICCNFLVLLCHSTANHSAHAPRKCFKNILRNCRI